MSECYKKNRARVFEIYGIDPYDKNYNCHHIFTKNDRKLGLIPVGYDINSKENLYPMRIRDHINLHKMIERIDLECEKVLEYKYIEMPLHREVAIAV